MNRLQQKRVARHIRVVNTRHDKFIAAYIKANYSEPFAEAKAFYEKLNNKYPTRRDLTKTDDFIAETTKYNSAYDMYRSRYETKTKAKKNQQKDTMALEIPLMNKEQVDIVVMGEKVDPSIAIPEDVYQGLVTDLCQDPALAMFFKENTEEEQPNLADEQVNKLGEEQPNLADEQVNKLGEEQPNLADEQVNKLGEEQPNLADEQVNKLGEEQPNLADEEVNKLLQEVDDILPQISDQTELEKELEQYYLS